MMYKIIKIDVERDGELVPYIVELIINATVDYNYGADADNNRGEQREVIHGYNIEGVYDEDENIVEPDKPIYDAIESKMEML